MARTGRLSQGASRPHRPGFVTRCGRVAAPLAAVAVSAAYRVMPNLLLRVGGSPVRRCAVRSSASDVPPGRIVHWRALDRFRASAGGWLRSSSQPAGDYSPNRRRTGDPSGSSRAALPATGISRGSRYWLKLVRSGSFRHAACRLRPATPTSAPAVTSRRRIDSDAYRRGNSAARPWATPQLGTCDRQPRQGRRHRARSSRSRARPFLRRRPRRAAARRSGRLLVAGNGALLGCFAQLTSRRRPPRRLPECAPRTGGQDARLPAHLEGARVAAEWGDWRSLMLADPLSTVLGASLHRPATNNQLARCSRL